MGSDAMSRLSDLVVQRDNAQRRVQELEDEEAAAGQARAVTRAALVEAERRGIAAAERTKLERALADAEARPNALIARAEGARAAVRDADVEMRKFVGENLSELVDGLEGEGRVAAANLNSAAEAVVAAYHERERIAAEISRFASMVGRVHPGDVSRSKAEQVVRAASDLVATGGEVAPTLEHDVRQPRRGAPAAAA